MAESCFLSLQGNVLRLRRILHEVEPCDTPERGVITGFSLQSRLRLLRYLNTVDFAGNDPVLFVTLTYPDEIDISKMKTRTTHRIAFHRTMERRLHREFPMLWRQEWIRRKSGACTGFNRPHFHLLLFHVQFIPYKEINASWRLALGDYEGPLNTDVRSVFGHEGAIKYIAKYVAKNPSLDIVTYLEHHWEIGRFWGICRPSLIKRFPEVVVEIRSPLPGDPLFRAVASVRNCDPEDLLKGFTLFGEHAKEIFDAYAERG